MLLKVPVYKETVDPAATVAIQHLKLIPELVGDALEPRKTGVAPKTGKTQTAAGVKGKVVPKERVPTPAENVTLATPDAERFIVCVFKVRFVESKVVADKVPATVSPVVFTNLDSPFDKSLALVIILP